MYLTLYRKWRPKTFEDVIGQPHITLTLKQEVQQSRTAHAYLFTGPRGTGKTTCSKILSMAINCTNSTDGNPCMECDSCKGIDQASILDVVEIDAASNNGVDNIRQLRDEASFTPTQCKYRVYIIDEAHMLSTGAFNALLKIMEEPPSHVVFILATTEAHKVPATILSRCQRFDFRRIKTEDIANSISKIAVAEAVTLTEQASMMLARLADGGMRDALSLLDQCIAYSTTVTEEVVLNAIGIVGKDYLYEMTDCILERDATKALLLIDKLYSMSKDLQSLLEELIFHFRNVMLCKTLKNPESLIAVLPDELEQLNKYASKLKLDDLLLFIAELQDCLDKMGKSIDRRLCFELCLIKLCTLAYSPTPAFDVASIISRLEKLENMINCGVTVNSTTEKPTPKSATKSISNVESGMVTAKPVDTDVPLTPLMEWAEILEQISETNRPLWGVLHGSTASTADGFLYIENALNFVSDMLRTDSNAAKLVAAVAEKTGIKYKIRVKTSTQREPTTGEGVNDLLTKAKELGVQVNEG